MTELVSRRMKERKADQNDLRTDDSSPSEGKLLTVSLLSSHSPFPFSFPSGVERRTEGMSVGRSVGGGGAIRNQYETASAVRKLG